MSSELTRDVNKTSFCTRFREESAKSAPYLDLLYSRLNSAGLFIIQELTATACEYFTAG